jgi:hypothetical protein
LTSAEALTQADLDPTDANLSAYFLACALAFIYDGGTMALSHRWSRDPQTVASLRRAAGVQAGQTLIARRTPP